MLGKTAGIWPIRKSNRLLKNTSFLSLRRRVNKTIGKDFYNLKMWRFLLRRFPKNIAKN